jgi:hypothetical protein
VLPLLYRWSRIHQRGANNITILQSGVFSVCFASTSRAIRVTSSRRSIRGVHLARVANLGRVSGRPINFTTGSFFTHVFLANICRSTTVTSRELQGRSERCEKGIFASRLRWSANAQVSWRICVPSLPNGLSVFTGTQSGNTTTGSKAIGVGCRASVRTRDHCV